METTIKINQKPVLLGIILSACVILYFASAQGTLTAPRTNTRAVPKVDNFQFIYRGIPIGHRGYANATSGISAPLGGNSKPWQHRDGMTNSNYTSWTTELTVAYKFATTNAYGRCDGIILVKKVDVSGDRFVNMEKEPGGDMFGEKEILVKGMINGCLPIKVTSGMNSSELLNLIKNAL
jgi:hypothetical protein